MKTNISTDLRCYNTLRLPVIADCLLEWHSIEELIELRNTWQKHTEIVILGAGSNLVITCDITVPCLRSQDKSIKLIKSRSDYVDVSVSAGCNWDDLVWYCLNQGWYGLENLVSIPGTVGAAPVQNIGAYGRQFADLCQSVTTFDWVTAEQVQYLVNQCDFSYRDSRFKLANNKMSNRTIITSVVIRLSKKATLNINESLKKDFQERLGYRSDKKITPIELAKKIKKLRQYKLPDHTSIANVGSFFHNPFIDLEHYARTPALHDKKHFVQGNKVKLSAAELIEARGWKGYRHSGAMVSEQHSLCIINKGDASGKDILELAHKIQEDIYQNYAVELLIEPAIYTGSR